MIQPLPVPKGMQTVWIKVVFSSWIFLVVFVYLLLYGPPEFWLFAERFGLMNVFQAWRSWLEPFFTANYLS